MKRLMALVLCLMVSVGFALAEGVDQAATVGCPPAEAEQRTSVYMIEGVSEEVVETQFVSADGYEIWYPSEYLAAVEQYGHESFVPVGADAQSDTYFLIVPSEADQADAEALLAEAVGGFGPETEISEVRWSTTADGSLLGAVDASADGTVFRFYLAANDETLLLITACFPEEAAEGFGVRFDRMAETIAFSGVQLTGRWEGEGFAIAYPEGMLEPVEIYGHAAFVPAGSGEEAEASLMIVRSDVAPENADALLDEAVGGYEDAVRGGETKELAGGLKLEYAEAEQDGRIDRFYLIVGEESVYCLTASFPVTGETDYGAYFDAMADTFELTEAQ